jgi:hypothetical protein
LGKGNWLNIVFPNLKTGKIQKRKNLKQVKFKTEKILNRINLKQALSWTKHKKEIFDY